MDGEGNFLSSLTGFVWVYIANGTVLPEADSGFWWKVVLDGTCVGSAVPYKSLQHSDIEDYDCILRALC